MAQMENTEIKANTAYYSPMHGMNHYFFQRPDCVIHINQTGPVVNRLDVNHIQNLEREFHEVPLEEYYRVAGEALEQLGFSFTPSSN